MMTSVAVRYWENLEVSTCPYFFCMVNSVFMFASLSILCYSVCGILYMYREYGIWFCWCFRFCLYPVVLVTGFRSVYLHISACCSRSGSGCSVRSPCPSLDGHSSRRCSRYDILLLTYLVQWFSFSLGGIRFPRPSRIFKRFGNFSPEFICRV